MLCSYVGSGNPKNKLPWSRWSKEVDRACHMSRICNSRFEDLSSMTILPYTLQDTVVALMGGVEGDSELGTGAEPQSEQCDLDGIPLFDNQPIDFSGGAALDGEPMVCVCVCVYVCVCVCV